MPPSNSSAAYHSTELTGPTPSVRETPYTWLPESEIYPGHVVSAIVDTAYELAEMYLEAGDTANARWTVERVFRRTGVGPTAPTSSGSTGSSPKPHRREDPAGRGWGQEKLESAVVGPKQVRLLGPKQVHTNKRAWLADLYRGDDELWRDIMRAEHIDGHNAQLRQLLGELMQARDADVPEDLAKSTYAWLRTALPDVLELSTTSSL